MTYFEGGFPLSRNFSPCEHVNFTRVNEIEAMYGRSRVNVKVEPRQTFTLTRALSILIYARKIYERSHGKITRQWKSTLNR